MTSQFITVQNKGIYHSLPTFPEHDGEKYTAIVTGANGISGSYIVDVLAETPERWSTIYAMSRRAPASTRSNVKNIAADFLAGTPEELAESFKKQGVIADYIFFASYVQPVPAKGEAIWSNTDEMESMNVGLLDNFLQALTIAKIIPKRFLLQTGGKHYGLHLGPTTVPIHEDSPRVPHPNFYFAQEDLLAKWCAANSGSTTTSWTVTRPGFILGAVREASMSVALGIAIYAAIQRDLARPLSFPADVQAWDASKDLSTMRLIAYFSEWAVLTPGAANQALNIVDDSRWSWGGFWPTLAEWYGIPYATPEADEAKYQTVTMPMSPPPRGFGPAGEVRVVWSFASWAREPEVRAAWERIEEREGLDRSVNPWRDEKALVDLWGTLDAEILGPWTRTESMDKSRKLGWNGFVDTKESMKEVLGQLAELKLVPKLRQMRAS